MSDQAAAAVVRVLDPWCDVCDREQKRHGRFYGCRADEVCRAALGAFSAVRER